MLFRVVLMAVLLASPAVFAQRVIVDPYYDYRDEVERGEYAYDESQDIPWIENETEVLAMPDESDLVPVRIDRMPQGTQLLIDRRRIDVNPADRVVRVWLWVRGRDGSGSGSFEGFRCETREYKVYAYAYPRRDPPVSKARMPRWRPVGETRQANYRGELLNDYFCGIRGVRSAEEIRVQLSGEFRRERFMSH